MATKLDISLVLQRQGVYGLAYRWIQGTHKMAFIVLIMKLQDMSSK